MKLKIQRNVVVQQWRIVATLGFAQTRPEIVALLLLAEELPDGVITGEAVCRKLLANRPAIVGERLLTVCHMMRLVERVEGGDGWRLTDLGRRAIQTREVPAPQRGEFDVWTLDDPLFPQAIVRVRPTELERPPKPGEDRDRSQPPPTTNAPAILLRCLGRTVRPPVRDEEEAHEVHFFHCEPLCRDIYVESGHLEVELTENTTKVRFDVVVAGRDCSFEGDSRSLALQSALVQAGHAPGPLSVDFAAMDAKERRHARREVDLPRISLPELGVFDSARLLDVPLVPSRQCDADEWGAWLLLDQVKGYVDAAEFMRLARVVRQFAESGKWGFKPDIPTRREHARRCGNNPTLCQWLLIPLEWEQRRGPDDGPMVVLSGRAAIRHEATELLKTIGTGATRVFVLQPDDLKPNDTLGGAANGHIIIRKVRQPPNLCLRLCADSNVGKEWIPAQSVDRNSQVSQKKPVIKVGGWHDISSAELDGRFEEAKFAFWQRATQELQLDGSWLAVRPVSASAPPPRQNI